MKSIKRILLSFLILTTVVILFRGMFYRHFVTYKSVGLRTNYSAIDRKLTDFIDANTGKLTDYDVMQIIKHALSMTSNHLNFTTEKNEVDPNKLINSRKAHCVGYATFFSTISNYLFRKYNLQNTWKAKPQIGQLYFLGTNIHKIFNSTFFKDHDFVTIENIKTGEIIAVDPTLNDYLHIDFVTYKKNKK